MLSLKEWKSNQIKKEGKGTMKRIGRNLLFAIAMIFTLSMVAPEVVPITTATTVEAASVKLNYSKLTLYKGQKKQLKLKGTKKKAKWSSSKKSVVSVDKKGKITAKKKGTAVITAKIGKKNYKCKVTVKVKAAVKKPTNTKPIKKPNISVKSISLDKSEVTLKIGEQQKLRVGIVPENATINQKIKWTTSNKNIASVNDGVITALDEGTVIITAQIDKCKAECKVVIKDPIESISCSDIELYRGFSQEIKVIGMPGNVILTKNISISSDNSEIVSIHGNKIAASGVGECNLTIKYRNITTACKITVLKNKEDLIKEENQNYEEKIERINSNANSEIASYKNKINTLKRQGYYTGTDSEYRSKKQSLNKEISSLNMEISSLEGSSSPANKARLAELKSQLSKKKDELDKLNTLYSNKKSIESYENNIEFLENDRKSDLAAAQKKHNDRIEEINALY